MNQLKCKVVMLSTNDLNEGQILKKHSDNFIFIPISKDLGVIERNRDSLNYIQPQHLYFLSNREIKEGDSMYHCLDKTIIKYTINGITFLEKLKDYGYCKVEATTDPSLNLPLIPQSFVRKYVEKQGKIEKVMIEMILEHDLRGGKPEFQDVVKTRPGTTCIVHPIKDSWTREEVIALLRVAFNAELEEDGRFEKWIENNL